MGLRIQVFLLCLPIQFLIVAAVTNSNDAAVLNAVKNFWDNEPHSWQGTDPCGDAWEGVRCTDTSVISITLSGVGLSGMLSGDITSLSELQTLDLSYNSGLSGPLPSNIGDLKNLSHLILVGCRFSGPIPDSIGSLTKLVYLSLNSNSFTGRLPPSIGNLAELFWLDLTDNKLTGTIPVSDGISPGLDMLASHTKHFHLGKNQLSGTIPEKLFSPNMVLIHVILESNNLTGELPSSLGLVKTLEVVRFSGNQLSGPVPSSLNNLISVQEPLLSNNELSGPMPNLAGMDRLSNLDMSNNSFDASGVPSWVSKLQSLTTLKMENTNLRGPVPSDVFSLPNLQTVVMRSNNLNGSLDIGTPDSDQLQLIDLGSNLITNYKISAHASNIDIILAHNPICQESGATNDFCTDKQKNISYSTPPPPNCMSASCSSDQISNSTCQCAYPFKGTLVFTAPSVKDWEDDSNYKKLEQSFIISFQSYNVPVDSIYLSNIHKDSTEQLNLSIKVVPYGEDRFNRTGISCWN